MKRFILLIAAFLLLTVPAFAAEYDDQITAARMEYYNAQKDYAEALESGDTEAAAYYKQKMEEAHDEAERIRSIYGFSGGNDGSDFIQLEDPVNQRDMDYSGPVDMETGEPEKEEEAVNTDDLILVTDGIYYDSEKDRFCYVVGDTGDYIYSNMMDGMVTAGYAKLSFPDDITVNVYRNGTLYEDDTDSIGLKGNYTVTYLDGQLELPLFGFQVVTSLTGELSAYRMPACFSVLGVTIDGEEQYNVSRSVVDMSAEGKYVISYCCQRSGVLYELKVTVDHTPPTLALEAVKNGIASGPVDISDVESGATVSVFYEGKEIAYTETLKNNGDYDVIISDAAGNTTEYIFHINVYFNVNSIVFILLFIAIIAGVVFYMMKARKKLRVR